DVEPILQQLAAAARRAREQTAYERERRRSQKGHSDFRWSNSRDETSMPNSGREPRRISTIALSSITDRLKTSATRPRCPGRITRGMARIAAGLPLDER